MPQCVFKICKNNARKSKLTTGLSYFRFPSNPFTCAEWISIVARERRDEFYKPGLVTIRCQLFDCHDDPGFDPEEGRIFNQFTWLGVLQYIHIKSGNPHYFRIPRVVLITRRYVLSTAIDAYEIPDGYALGNVAFGDYERDETECGIPVDDIANGASCDPTILLMPIEDVIVHPEYLNLGIRKSIALLKLVTTVKSNYMLPVCLPYQDFLRDKFGNQTKAKIIHLDYLSDVPRDFIEEEKIITKFNLLPQHICDSLLPIHEKPLPKSGRNKTLDHLVCSTGCGFHSGAPSLYHEHTGHWNVMLLASGSSPCPDPLGTGRTLSPPQHIAIYPYLSWITDTITGRTVTDFSEDDPFGYVMPRASYRRTPWVGRWWMGGIRCYDRGVAAVDINKFYHENFFIEPRIDTVMTYNLQIEAPPDVRIVCVKVGLPYTYTDLSISPKLWRLNTPAIKLRIPLMKFKRPYYLKVEAYGCKVEIDDNRADPYLENIRNRGQN